jgi:carbon storage regulator
MGLVLNRRVGETIVIADCIQVKILDVLGKHVKIVIEAPDDIIVDRYEVHVKKEQEKHATLTCVNHAPYSGNLKEQGKKQERSRKASIK